MLVRFPSPMRMGEGLGVRVIPTSATILRWLGEGAPISAPRRILMIAPTSFFADYGCHVRILEEVRALQRRGHSVRLCTYHNGETPAGIAIRRTLDIPWRKREIVGSSRHKLYLDAMLFFVTLRETVRFKPDVIHAHLHEGALIGGVIGRVLRIPTLFDYQGSLTEEMLDHHFIRRGGLRERLVRRIERLIDRLPQMIVPSGVSAEQHLLRHGAPRRRVRLLADAANPERFDPARTQADRLAQRRVLGIPEDAPVVVYLGLLAEYQGIPLLLQAAQQLLNRRPEVYFVIAGYPGVAAYAAEARRLGISERALFPGRVRYEDAPALLAVGDVAVAPKLSTTEGNGKLYNYMAMQLPIVALSTPANRAILGELGHYAPPHDPSAFAAAIEAAFNDLPARRAALRERVVYDFSWSMQAVELEALYNSLLDEEWTVAAERMVSRVSGED